MGQYSSYKDSGFEWIGKIPSHWGLLKSKFLWRESFDTSATGMEDLLSVSQYDGVTPANGSRSESLVGYKVVEENNLVINIMLAWMGGLGVSAFNGLVSPAYCVYKLLGDNNPKYMHYLYKTPMYLAEFARHSTGVIPSRWRMYTDDFGQVLTLIPPRKEQDAMVEYLDAATAKIDEAIAQQQRMIDLLNERKRIIVFNSITKGVKSNAMKEIGIEDIGVSHREVRSLKTVMSIQRGFDLTAEQFINGPYPVYGSGGLMGYHKMKTSSAPSIIIGRSGSVGKLQFITDDFWAHNTTIYLSDTKGNNVRYLYYLLSAIDLQSLATQTAVPTLDRKNVLSYKFPIVLDIKEQNLIASYLDAVINAIDTEIEHRNCSINLLQERKQIIINDVVTGKVRVV